MPTRKWFVVALLAVIIATEGIYIVKGWVDFRQSNLNLGPGSREITRRNTLKISGKSAVQGPIEIPILEPINFNFKTRKEILSLRKKEVAAHRELYQAPYEPMPEIFGQIVDKKPWWGQDGLFFFSAGKKSIDGPSERSQPVINPYLLVDLDGEFSPLINFYHLDFVSFFEAKFNDPDFSYFPKPEHLIWHPESAKAEVTYDVSGFLKFIEKHAHRKMEANELELEFRMLNARDWGFDYSYLDLEHSTNMSRPGSKPALNQNRDLIHLGGSCGYPGGCNNHSPTQEELIHIYTEALPAMAQWRLWRKAPLTVNSKPDFVFEIKFK